MKVCEACPTPVRGRHARFCPSCRWKRRRKPCTYVWTPKHDQVLRDRYDSRIKGRAVEIAQAWGWPDWVIKQRAAYLGLTHPPVDRKPWTKEEEQFLWLHAGSKHLNWIRKQLGRSLSSVALKLKRMRISYRWREGYTLRELELCFGTDHHVIERWVKEGKLRVRHRGTDRDHDAWCVSDDAVLRFIQDHPMSFRLDKVDQFWFMDLIADGGVVKKALAAIKEAS